MADGSTSRESGRGDGGGAGAESTGFRAKLITGVFLVRRWSERRPVRHRHRGTEIAQRSFGAILLWLSVEAPVFSFLLTDTLSPRTIYRAI